MSKKRVVITGMGTVNPLGHSVSEYWDNLQSGVSGIQTISDFDVSAYTTRFAGQVKNLDLSQYFDKKEIRRSSRFILLGTASALMAIENAGLDISKNPNRIGVEVGSGIGGLDVLEESARTLHERGPSKLSPFTVPMMIPDMASGHIAIVTGAKGHNSCSVTACASSNNAMGNAFQTIRYGLADVMITGGSEACVTPLGLGSFCAARSLSTRNDDPDHASRPFDKERDGFVMGEGSGIVIFEDLEYAQNRNANILAEVVGFGATGDAYHITAPAPEGEGAKRAMQVALADAGIPPSDIDYINAHGTSTELNDKNETQAIKDVFGDVAYQLSISSTKSMTGHLLGAAGAIEIIACIKAIESSVVPPTINYQTPDPNCDLDVTPNKSKSKELNYVMSNSFGFGGHNAVLIIKKISN
ncbi:MAG: beta-ketoacyl-ACP synthase II [Candidatus Margulisbacteria bacterium]|nr:beta-ketoacyl-ACP synthase II [Candidatus Margulisiibacteriota bacterium]